MTIATIQPTEAASKDTWIDASNQTTNYGNDAAIRTAGPASTAKILIQFDLSAIPAGSIINSATLVLVHFGGSSSQTVNVHRGLTDWTESGATWQRTDGSNTWGGGDGGGSGTDYASSAAATASVFGPSSPTWNLTSEVDAMINGGINNRGWWVIQPSGIFKEYRSSSYTTASERPKLVVDYTEIVSSPIEGSSSGISTVLGVLIAAGTLAGSISGQTTINATLISNEFIRGNSEGGTISSGNLVATGYLTGSVAGTSVVSGDIQGEILLSPGSSQGSSVASGDIKGVYYMVGESFGSSSASASGSFEGQLRGQSNGLAIVSGLGWAKAIGIASLQDCYPLPLFYITNGAYKSNGQQDLLNLISDKFGYRLNDYTPAVAQFKDGGRWANSPTAQGRRLKGYVFDNAVEVLDLNLVGYDQNKAIQFIHDLWRFQQATADYWSSAWSTLPVYLVSRAARESNTNYAIIHQISCPQLKNLFTQPFFDDKQAAFDTITLRVERGHWGSTPPGEFECVPISSIRSWTVAGWQSGS